MQHAKPFTTGTLHFVKWFQQNFWHYAAAFPILDFFCGRFHTNPTLRNITYLNHQKAWSVSIRALVVGLFAQLQCWEARGSEKNNQLAPIIPNPLWSRTWKTDRIWPPMAWAVWSLTAVFVRWFGLVVVFEEAVLKRSEAKPRTSTNILCWNLHLNFEQCAAWASSECLKVSHTHTHPLEKPQSAMEFYKLCGTSLSIYSYVPKSSYTRSWLFLASSGPIGHSAVHSST